MEKNINNIRKIKLCILFACIKFTKIRPIAVPMVPPPLNLPVIK